MCKNGLALIEYTTVVESKAKSIRLVQGCVSEKAGRIEAEFLRKGKPAERKGQAPSIGH